jgi:NTP pyrophosphatase (non-canonical NTP hydrolase)
MKFSELVHEQNLFQEPRGLNKHNVPTVVFDRTMLEVEELREEIEKEDYEKALAELVDVVIMTGAIALALIRKLGIEETKVDEMIASKMAVNHDKYALEHFQKVGNSGINLSFQRARHWYNNGHHFNGNDYY